MQKLKILTFNAGLLDLHLGGITLFKPTDFLAERLNSLPSELIEADADIIALQEVFSKKHQNYLITQLKNIYPFSCITPKKWLSIGNGLMIFSKLPIADVAHTPFCDNRPIDEMLVARKGILSCKVEMPTFGQLHILNIHTTSGGLFHQQDENLVIKIRNNQINQAYNIVNQCSNLPSIILGDFNAGQEIATENYENLLTKNFTDAYATYCKTQNLTPCMTWDNTISLNRNGTHATSRAQRIDHIYLSPKFVTIFNILNSEVIFQKAIVLTSNEKVHLSDHYGLTAEFSTK